MKYALLGAIEVLGNMLLETETSRVSMDIKLTEEQKAKFIGILAEIRSDARVRIANASEYGQWVLTYGSSHRPDRFGLMIFH